MPKKQIRQVDYMRKLIKDLGRNQSVVCPTYAKAERDGIVRRKSNKNNTSPEDYAVALWKDGERKVWF